MDIGQTSVTRFAESLRARGKQPATIESYCRDAQRFLDYLSAARMPPNAVTSLTLLEYQAYLKNLEERDNSVRRTVIGIRQFYRFLSEAREIRDTPFDVVPIPARDDVSFKGLAYEDIESLLTVALSGRPDCKAARDAALVSLLAHEGIKANELIALVWSDYLPEQGRGSLRIGGGRARAIQLSQESNALLQAYRRHYLEIRHPVVVNAPQKHVFIAFKGRDAASPLAMMTRHGLKFILYELGDKAGIAKLNTEQLRHFAVGYLIALSKSPEEIMMHLGLRRLGNIAKHLGGATGVAKTAPRPLVGATKEP